MVKHYRHVERSETSFSRFFASLRMTEKEND